MHESNGSNDAGSTSGGRSKSSKRIAATLSACLLLAACAHQKDLDQVSSNSSTLTSVKPLAVTEEPTAESLFVSGAVEGYFEGYSASIMDTPTPPDLAALSDTVFVGTLIPGRTTEFVISSEESELRFVYETISFQVESYLLGSGPKEIDVAHLAAVRGVDGDPEKNHYLNVPPIELLEPSIADGSSDRFLIFAGRLPGFPTAVLVAGGGAAPVNDEGNIPYTGHLPWVPAVGSPDFTVELVRSWLAGDAPVVTPPPQYIPSGPGDSDD